MCTATTLHSGLMLEAFRSRNCSRLLTQAESDTNLNRARRYFQPALMLPTTQLSPICSWADSFFQRVGGPSSALLLMSNPQREIEQRAKAVFERCVALDLAANVTDDAAKPRAQKLQFPPRAFELVGMRVAPHHDGGTLG